MAGAVPSAGFWKNAGMRITKQALISVHSNAAPFKQDIVNQYAGALGLVPPVGEGPPPPRQNAIAIPARIGRMGAFVLVNGFIPQP